MARPRKPLEMQKSHLTLVQKQNREIEEELAVTENDELRIPPEWLVDDIAVKEWKRIVEQLEEIEMVGNLDYANLGGYCNAYANYIRATDQLKHEKFIIERRTRTGTIIVRNPLIDVQQQYAAELRRFASLCGMTVDARLRAASAKKEKKEDVLEKKFGNI